ncbi:hypothetical protein JCM19233_7508 [Vibrio astriarenae]|nr:hypothetical protein JCM19233_7508 [Vibrio sp. C7]
MLCMSFVFAGFFIFVIKSGVSALRNGFWFCALLDISV